MSKEVSRRSFLSHASTGVVAGLVMQGGTLQAAANDLSEKSKRLPREVWIASVCQHGLNAKSPEEMSSLMLKRMEEILPLQPDIICLPELFHTSNVKGEKRPIKETSEKPIGPISQPFANFAKEHRCNVICSISTVDAGHYFNSAVVIDRKGNYVGEYRKINPTEDELDMGFSPGPLDPPVFDLDFGKIGIQTCYDINWHDNWRKLRQKGAEVVFWPSAYAGGKMLHALAWIHKYFVVSSTRIHSSSIIDLLGEEVVSTGRFDNWVCAPINLDVAVVQTWVNINKLDAARAKYGRKLDIKVHHVEAWARIESRSADLSVKDVLQEFEMETSDQMFARETLRQNKLRPSV